MNLFGYLGAIVAFHIALFHWVVGRSAALLDVTMPFLSAVVFGVMFVVLRHRQRPSSQRFRQLYQIAGWAAIFAAEGILIYTGYEVQSFHRPVSVEVLNLGWLCLILTSALYFACVTKVIRYFHRENVLNQDFAEDEHGNPERPTAPPT